MQGKREMTEKPGGMPAPTRGLGQYEIVREIGRGGMATVYLARQIALERSVALKELGSFHAGSTDLAQRFLRESRLAGSLNHPNVVTVHEYFEYSGTPYIAMEYLQRGSLRPYVGRLDLATFAGVMEGILAGLAHAETLGIVHRDLKPENIMVTNEGRVKITDFGIAKATMATGGAGAFKTATGMTVGTPAYMSPEQIRGDEVGIWTDLYSLGVMAYEHAVGKVPFHDSDVAVAILVRHVNEAIPPPRDLNPDIDPDLSTWIERLLIKEPTKRTQSPAAAWEELEEIVLRLLGPRWRRSARLPEKASQLDPPRPLTPAPFESQSFDSKRASLPAATNSTELDTPALESNAERPIATTEPSAPPSPRRAVATTRRSAGPSEEAGTTAVPPAGGVATRAPGRSSRLPVLGAAVLAVAAVVVAGFVIGHAGRHTRVPGLATRTVHQGQVSLSVPAAWIVPSATPQIPSLTLANAFAREDPSSGGIMIAGTIRDAGGKLLLTPSFVSRLHPAPGTDDPVHVGDAYAYRFRNLAVSGLAGPLTLLVSPTTGGVIGIGCLPPAVKPGPFLAACESAAGTLRLSGTQPLALGPNRAYATSLAKAVSTLRSADPTARALAKASTRGNQAKLSLSLSRAEASAASTLASGDPGPDAANLNVQLVAALRGAAAGYQNMTTAARTGSATGYDTARQQTARELTAIGSLLAGLQRIGYKS